jgi:GT2 family glycosyltransferase
MGISIVIPSTGERTQVLMETLSSVVSAIDSIEAEVIVIKKKEKYVELIHPKVRLIDVDFNNVSKSRNLGAELALYELLFFIDDDIVIESNNLTKLIEFERIVQIPYVVSAIWLHSTRVKELQENTFLGQMLATYFPNDSFETRYKKVAEYNDWQAGRYFKSGMKSAFWEVCFSMRRSDYLRIGGMNEQYSFGYEGVDFLKRLLAAGIEYYVDAGNVVFHNEWDKFNDWQIPEKRWQVEAQLINDGKGSIRPTYKNFLYKFLYGIVVYSIRPALSSFLHAKSAKTDSVKADFKLFDVYSMSIYWHQINWSTLLRLHRTK